MRSARYTLTWIGFVGLMVALSTNIWAQQAPPAPGDEAQLIAVLQSDAELFDKAKACQRLAETDQYQAVIALGCVIRGATPHFDYVAGECAKGLGQVATNSSCAVIFGVLTTDSIEQAIERAGTKAGNKGADAAVAAIEMVDLLARISAN